MTKEPVETLDLVVFLAVAHHGSFTAAATELLFATPSVSARMTALEHKLATELFVRTTRGSTLTPAGHRFVPYARRCLDTLQDARHAVRTDGRDRVVVAAPASLGAMAFGPVLTILGTRGLDAHCRVAHSVEVLGLLATGTADIGLTLSQVARPGMVVHRLCRSELVTVCRPGHPLTGHHVVGVEDLLTSGVAIYRWQAEAEALADTFDHPNRSPEHPVHLVGLPSVALQLTREQQFVAVVPTFAVTTLLRTGALVELALALPGWSLDVQLVHLREHTDNPGVRALLDDTQAILDTIQ